MKVNTISQIRRFLSTSEAIKPKICIVGAGPAGFYAAQHLIKKLETPQIDIYDRLPVPFGLVRFGVAPDHPEVKNVIKTFTKTAEHKFVNFFGNVNLGTDICLEDLKRAYHIVLLAYGAEKSRTLNIPGEELPNVISARKIVGWYNGVPWDKDIEINLNVESVAIFGQGNVAIDVARILLSPVDLLKMTDITQYALEALTCSKIKQVFLIGRRGPIQAAFTIKELREILKLSRCATIWRPEDFKHVADYVPDLARPKKRISELMLESLQENKMTNGCRELRPVFHRSPLSFSGTKQIEKIELGITQLQGDNILKQSAVLTEGRETLYSELAVTSIGYKSIQVDSSIPFDDKQGIIPNVNGKIEKGLYVSGWLSTGPTGVILTTMSNAFGTAEMICKDIVGDKLVIKSKPGNEVIKKLLEKNNIQTVSWKDWVKIDKHEQMMGEKLGKPREKVVDIKKMLEIAAS